MREALLWKVNGCIVLVWRAWGLGTSWLSSLESLSTTGPAQAHATLRQCATCNDKAPPSLWQLGGWLAVWVAVTEAYPSLWQLGGWLAGWVAVTEAPPSLSRDTSLVPEWSGAWRAKGAAGGAKGRIGDARQMIPHWQPHQAHSTIVNTSTMPMCHHPLLKCEAPCI